MPSVRVTTELPPQAMRLLERAGGTLLFHQPRWIEAMRRAYPRFRPAHLLLEEDGSLSGVLPVMEKRAWGLGEVVSSPFGTYGGPILDAGASRDGVRALAKGFLARARRFGIFRFEMTLFDAAPHTREDLVAVLGGFAVPSGTWIIDLGAGEEAVWNGYEGRARTAVRRARELGVAAAVEDGDDAIAALHGLHEGQGRRRPIPWYHAREGLAAVKEVLGEDARVWLARHEGKPVAGALVLSNPGADVHAWVTGASDAARPVHAFTLLMHEAIADAARRGQRVWDFGASADDPRVEFFKRAFGGGAKETLRFFHEAVWVAPARRRLLPSGGPSTLRRLWLGRP